MSVIGSSDLIGRALGGRKLIAVVYADMVGYSRLIGLDDLGTLERLRILRGTLIDPAINEHGGRIVQTGGDSLLIAFDSIDGAMRYAIKMQQQVPSYDGDQLPDRAIRFRVGINIGDVIANGTDLHGEGVNVAARLQAECPPGGIYVSRVVRDHVHGRLDLVFDELGVLSFRNISRPVEAFLLRLEPVATEPRSLSSAPPLHSSVRKAKPPKPPRLFAMVAGTATIAAPERPSPPPLSLVVLPFVNLDDESQDRFTDGLTGTLTTDLSHIIDASVIARDTAFTFKAKHADARQLGRELGVRYVIEGSVQSAGDVIRINAQLIDADTRTHLWAERFDKPRSDPLVLQDDICQRLKRALHVELVQAEHRRMGRSPSDPASADDLAVRGWAIQQQKTAVEHAREARCLFEAALRPNAHHLSSLLGLAHTLEAEVHSYACDDPSWLLRLADATIEKALALAPDSAAAHEVCAWVHSLRAPDRALRELEIARSLDPSRPWLEAQVGLAKLLLGRAEETEAHVFTEMARLSSSDPMLADLYWWAGLADLRLGRFDQATQRIRIAAELNPGLGTAWFFLAAAEAALGRERRAAEACSAGRRLIPHFRISRLRTVAVRDDNPVSQAQRQRIGHALRKAGVPE